LGSVGVFAYRVRVAIAPGDTINSLHKLFGSRTVIKGDEGQG